MTLGPGLAPTPLPQGFHASGINCGVRRYRPDLGVLLSDFPATTVAVFTQNQCKAAPIQRCEQLLPSTDIRAIITNSGQANAATGELGQRHDREMAQALAEVLGCQPGQVLTASTGVIGQPLDINKICGAISELVTRAQDSAEGFACAIMTTDLVPKSVSTWVELKAGRVRLTGICKGSGMIHPNMATMLGYLVCDVKIKEAQAIICLREAVDQSFNMISVDGDCSTNDCVFLMCNGASQIEIVDAEDLLRFRTALTEVAKLLAQAIARDGEGASKLIEVQVKGATELATARRAARGVTLSPLVKTAMHGEDPNWGRVLSRLGAEQVPAAWFSSMELRMQGHLLFSRGAPCAFDRALVREDLRKNKITLEIDFQQGDHSATAWGCDLSKKYVEINTEYPT